MNAKEYLEKRYLPIKNLEVLHLNLTDAPKIMEEYAEQKALEFKEWVDCQAECDLKYYKGNEEGYKSDQELYKEFLKQTNK